MASGGSPHEDYKSRNSDFKPRSNRKPPRYGTGFEAELSLNSELQRGETGEYHSLPNNLTWTGGTSNESRKVNKSKRAKELTQRGQSSDEPPTRFTRKKHTPATLPRTKFSSDSFGTTQRRAMDKLRQRLTFNGGEEREVGEERVMKPSRIVELPANNERNVQQPSSGAAPTEKKGGHPLPLENGNSSNAVVPPIDSSKVIERLKQVREYLKQATSLFIALNSKSTSPDEATDEDLDQLDKLAKLIKHLKTQEKAYVDFVQRSIAVYRESSIDNTPSTSVVSLDGDHQDDLVSVEGEDLEGLQQQHALLRKMVEQQRQLKELQERQNALLDLQRDAENQLKEAENEGMRISSLLNGNLSTDRRQTSDVAGSVSGRSGTERSDESHSSQRGAIGGRGNWKQTSRDDLRQLNRGQQELRNRRSANGQKPENFKNQRPARNEEAPVYESTGSVTPDNEAQALAMADAAQERLELESKLMDLEAKKEQMDTLVEQLKELREMQLGKEMALPQQRSINETIENGEEDVSFTTKSAKDTGDNVDDEKILEALQLHRKLRKLQDVRDKLEKLKDLFGEEGGPSEHQSRTTARINGAVITEDPVETDDTASVSARESATEDDGVTNNGVLPGSLDWILNSGIDDPDLLAKLRQVKAAKERVANLKRQKEQNNGAQPTSITNAGTSLVRDVVEDEDSGAVAGTDGETSGSISSTLMWQEDPEFQEKLRKLNAARKKLKRLQELVKKTEELPNRPNGEPYLPAELVEMSFSSDDYDEDNESEEENADHGNNGVVNRGGTDSEEDATSEALVEDVKQTLGERAGENDLETEIAYMDKLTKQKAALSHLLSEKQKLLETQEQFNRLQTTDAVTQTRTPTKCKQLHTFIHNHTEASTSRQRPSVDSATQTFAAPNRRSEEQVPRPDALPSNSLLWWELRRQRELQEQKLKKRKETLMLEKKRRISGIDNGSDVGGNSVEDEGIGRSTLSADVTTATWGGSTQMSSTQNDSAVSDDGSSNETDEEILAEVEDDPSDGIVQAEEEEEEENSELEMFPLGASDQEKFKKNRGMKQNAREKRLLFEGLRKRDLERHERFKGWQNSLFSSGNKKHDKKQQESSDAHEDERYNRERDMWERQFNLQQSQLENTTSLCNTLLRDQQTLISLLLNRADNSQSSAFASGRNSFSQYQQRQQDAFQGIQNYFEQQRFLVQQQQMLQNLTECYSQMQQQHEDMLHLQRSFTQLFSLPSLEGEQNGDPLTDANEVPLNGENSRTSRSFNFRPETSVKETPPPSPFVNQAASVERHSNPPVSSSSQVHGRSTWSSGIRNRQFQFAGSTSPETGVPSPQGNNTQGFNMQAPVPVKPVSARVVDEPKQNKGNPSFAYNSGAYTDSMPSTSNVVVGKQFPTPLRATAAALLAGQDKSSLRGVKRRKVDALQDKLETDSISSHQSSLPGDSEKPGTESDAQSDYSLFEALRDSIYSEVATLISQNESRPHFLIELFRELQLLSSDYLRQRALYSLRDLLTRFLKDDPPGGTIESAMGSYPWIESTSEQTPSESAGLSETDQDQDKEMEPKIPEVSTQGIYDYVEAVESGSTLSTPNSTGHEPFASEFLGETVIHLDKALRSVRERRESENSSVDVNDVRGAGVQGDEISSGGDVASESSLPDIQYPKIDTQALDRQIKKIMAEVIPCLNDHMEDSCSVDLLEYIRKMVMGMIQQKNEGREFNRFFHKQLESILQDSLAKFIGKRMKDCGEALLVDISEILFNELAFFKLMQELDGGITKAKFFNRQQKYEVPIPVARNDPLSNKKSTEMSDNTAQKEEEADDEDELEIEMENENAEDQEAEEDNSSDNEFQSIGKRPDEKKPNEGPLSREQLEQDEEALGRERDDAMAEEFDESRSYSELAATESAQSFKVVELSMSESKPLASSGSGEEDESEVEIEEEQPNAAQHEENPEGTNWSISMNGSSPQHNEQESQMAANGSREEQGAVGDPNKQDDDQDDYLPTKFTGLTEADLQVKIAEEQSRNDGIRGIVLSINDGEELVGGVALEPEGTELLNGDIDEPEK